MPIYTNINKPTGTPYTNISKPTVSGKVVQQAGWASGLLMPLTWSQKRIINSAWNNIGKPTGTGYTNINKPTT